MPPLVAAPATRIKRHPLLQLSWPNRYTPIRDSDAATQPDVGLFPRDPLSLVKILQAGKLKGRAPVPMAVVLGNDLCLRRFETFEPDAECLGLVEGEEGLGVEEADRLLVHLAADQVGFTHASSVSAWPAESLVCCRH